jgi:hypothetical protein
MVARYRLDLDLGFLARSQSVDLDGVALDLDGASTGFGKPLAADLQPIPSLHPSIILGCRRGL